MEQIRRSKTNSGHVVTITRIYFKNKIVEHEIVEHDMMDTRHDNKFRPPVGGSSWRRWLSWMSWR